MKLYPLRVFQGGLLHGRFGKNAIPPPFRAARAHTHAGFTIVEVLVSVIVAAFGLLGVAGLLAKSAAYSNTAHARTVVTQKIYSLVDRMRANPKGVADGNYNTEDASSAGSSLKCTACTPAQMAAYDLYQWSQELRAPPGELPGGKGSVEQVPNTNRFTIKVTWNTPSQDPAKKNTTISYSLNVRP